MKRKTFVDQLKREVFISDKPTLIVSLVPSITDFLHHLELDDEVVGITKFCILPESWYASKQRVGGTKTINLDVMDELKPDLIIETGIAHGGSLIFSASMLSLLESC